MKHSRRGLLRHHLLAKPFVFGFQSEVCLAFCGGAFSEMLSQEEVESVVLGALSGIPVKSANLL